MKNCAKRSKAPYRGDLVSDVELSLVPVVDAAVLCDDGVDAPTSK
jgi:hypothetical protein